MKIRTIFHAAALIVAAGAPLQLNAQITEGQRVRIISPANGYYEPTGGTVMLIMPDSVVLGIRTLQHTIALSDIERVQVSAGKKAHMGEVVFGTGAGLATGWMAGWLHHNISGPQETWSPEAKADYYDLRPALLVGGGTIGLLLGLFLPGDRWRSAPVNFAVGSQGSAVVVSHRF